jgi:serine/threonine protein kinase/tetratricopeptide (TPR) repeat protein
VDGEGRVETFGKYELLSLLATGGMAQIFLARELHSGRPGQLVVKRLLPQFTENEDFVTMFLNEARIAARLRHPNVVRVFDLGAEGSSYFIAMEHVHGRDLHQVHRQARRAGTPFPAELACRVIIDACAGLDHAHKQADADGRPLGIVHRDVSPQNLLLAFDGSVKVVDFGIAKAADQVGLTRSGIIKGKCAYMSPEQALGEPLDHRSDVFALGVVLHELLTGERLFKRATDAHTLMALVDCQVPPPSKVNAAAPRALDALVLSALGRQRADRYGDAHEFSRALEAWLAHQQRPSTHGALATFLAGLFPEATSAPAETDPPPATAAPVPPELVAPAPETEPPTLELDSPYLSSRPGLLEPGTMVDDRFRVEAHLATGGMGEVYRAEHVHLKRPVALKLIRRAFAHDASSWARFRREAELVSKLESAHVVRVFDFGRTSDGQLYLAMEYVDGTTLDVLVREGPLPPEQVTGMLLQVCEGLAEAHALGVIHRDLKPGNLVLGRRRDGTPVVKILDFGIARGPSSDGGQRLTRLGSSIGTPAYMAPEQARAEAVDHRTDVYALGCVAYELLTGQPPFRAASPSALVLMHLNNKPAPLEQLRPALAARPALCAAVLRALEKTPADRFSSVGELARALSSTEAPTSPAPVADWPPAEPPPARPSAPQPPAATPEPLAPPTGELPFVAGRRPETGAGTQAVFAFVEVVGVAPSQGRELLRHALPAVAPFDGFLEADDEDGLLLGFTANAQPPATRAALATFALRAAVEEQSARLATPGRLRAALVAGQLASQSAPVPAALARARLLCASGGDQVVCERALLAGLEPCVVATQAGDVARLSRGATPRRAEQPLVGRAGVLTLLERRLSFSVRAPLVVRGAAGAGRTALALELASRAREHGHLVVSATATPAWRHGPGALVEALACSAAGVPRDARRRLLPPALAALGLSASLCEAVLIAAGVVQLPWAFTVGQAVHALRELLRAAAGGRRVVLLIDGLEHVDQQGLEAFATLVRHPVEGELTIAFTSPALANTHLEGASVSDLPALSRAELGALALGVLGVSPGERLLNALEERAHGLPGHARAWLELLVARGALREGELADDLPDLDAAGAARAWLSLQPVATQRAFEAAAAQGEVFDLADVPRALPGVPRDALDALASRALSLGAERWMLRRSGDTAATSALRSAEGPVLHRRLALTLVERGKAAPRSVDPLVVGRHFLASGDLSQACALLEHAAEAALRRRAPAEAADALRGLAAALRASAGASARRLDCLVRAAALRLAARDPAAARAYLDEALALAEPGPGTAELWLVHARSLRVEGRRSKAESALARAEPTPEWLRALVAVERGETLEGEGDAVGAMVAFEAALAASAAGATAARWHGEFDLRARVEARLAALSLQLNDVPRARRLFQSSAALWGSAGQAAGEARALSSLGAAGMAAKDPAAAAISFAAAAEAAGRSGDLLLQARALLQLARVQARAGAQPEAAASARTAQQLAQWVGWGQGAEEARALSASTRPEGPTR